MKDLPPDGMHEERLTEQEQKLLFKRWKDQQRRDSAEQSEPTVGDIAEAYQMPPAEVYRQLQEVRAGLAQAAGAVQARRQGMARGACRGGLLLLAAGLGWLLLSHLGRTLPGETAVGAASRHDRQGDRSYDAKRFSEAEGEYVLAVQLEPNVARYRNSLGGALYSQKKYAESLPQFREAVRLMPEREIYVQNLADAYLDLARYLDAAASYRAALLLDPNSAAAHTGLGDSLRKMDKDAEAEQEYRAALRLSPGDSNILDALGVAVGNQHRITEAAACFKQAIATDPANRQCQSHLQQAQTMLREGKP